MSSSPLKEDLFKMAGLEKNSFLGRWDFLFTSPFATSSTSAPQQNPIDSGEEDRMRLVDSIDLNDLSMELPNGDEGGGVEENQLPGVTKKKKPKKKKNAAKRTNRSVKWGNVEQICFSRSIGYDSIPNKGVYPIGLGVEQERVHSTIDQLYTAQQQHLLQRAVAKGLQFKTTEAIPPPPPTLSPSPQVTASSKGKKNHRKRSNSVTSVGSVDSTSATATGDADLSNMPAFPPGTINVLQMLETRQFDFKSASNPLFQPLGEDERIALLTGESADIVSDPLHASHNPLTEINNEIKMLKSLRQKETLGCACKHLKADKLSVAKLKAELLAGQHLICYDGTAEEIEALPKAELMKKVKETLKHCVLCVTNDCQCVQLGIQCSAQLCGCMRSGHNPEHAQSCANPEGRDLYDPAHVKEYRRAVLAGLRGIGPCATDIAD